MTKNPEKKQNEGHSRAIERFEALVMELNRAVFQFGLFMPPFVMWEDVFRRLNPDEIKYATDLLRVIYNHVHHPELLFSNYYVASEQWERIQKYDPADEASEDMIENMYNQDFSIMDKPFYAQSIFYYKFRNRGELAEILRLYVDYLANLRDSLDDIAWNNHKIRIHEGFNPIKKIFVGYGLDKLELVADFLIKEGCIASSSKANFLALFGNVFMKKDTVVQWIKENDSHSTNLTSLKEVFVVLGVDMEDKQERDNVARLFRGIDNETLVIRSRGSRPNRTKELEAFSSRLQKVLGI